MPVYPVAYRAAAIAIEQGFQVPRLPNAPLPVLAFMAAFYATWKALDYFDPEGAKKLEEVSALDAIFGDKKSQAQSLPSAPALAGAWPIYVDCRPTCYISGSCHLSGGTWCGCIGTCHTGYNPIGPIIGYDQITKAMGPYIGEWSAAGGGWYLQYVIYQNPKVEAGSTDRAYPKGLPVSIAPDRSLPLSPAFPTSWDLPVRGYGEIADRPFPIPGVELPGRVAPGVVPGTQVGAVPGVGTGVGVGELVEPLPRPIVLVPGAGTVAAFPAEPLGRNHFPPTKGKSEVKMKGKAAKGIRWLANFLTESKDFIEALWKALPKEMRSKCKGPRGGKAKCTVQQMVADLYKAREYMSNNEGYVKRAVIEVIVNEIGDMFYGLAGQKFKAAGQKLRELGYWSDRPAGWQTGDRYRPRPKTPGSHTDYVHDWVESAVNFVW